ncbi:MAG: hypothetical protein HY020_18440 [Burkholderiales bacterium]|nr:hypothetical protein [Burkholderiales bacterium]
MAEFDIQISVPSEQSAKRGERDVHVRLLSSALDGVIKDADNVVLGASVAVSRARALVDETRQQLARYLQRARDANVLDTRDQMLRQLAREFFLVRHENSKFTQAHTPPGTDTLTQRAGGEDEPYVFVFRRMLNVLAPLASKLAEDIKLKTYGQHFLRPETGVAPEGHTEGYVKAHWVDAKKKTRVEGGKIHLNFSAFANQAASLGGSNEAWQAMTRTFLHEATHKYFYTADVFYVDYAANTHHRYWKPGFEVKSAKIGEKMKKVLNPERALSNADAFAYFIVGVKPAGRLDTPWIPQGAVLNALTTCRNRIAGLPDDSQGFSANFDGMDVVVSRASPRWQPE